MSHVDEQNPLDEQGAVLGSIPSGPADTTLGNERPPLRIPRRQQRQAPEPAERMPKGAWVRLRAAGGIMFRRSELVVFEDGRLTYHSSPTATYGQTLLARELTDAQVDAVRSALAHVDFVAHAAGDTHRGRDTIAYELTVREGRKTNMLEAFQGSLSEDVANLIGQLGALVRVGAEEIEP